MENSHVSFKNLTRKRVTTDPMDIGSDNMKRTELMEVCTGKIKRKFTYYKGDVYEAGNIAMFLMNLELFY
jgi:hypothetical protein